MLKTHKTNNNTATFFLRFVARIMIFASKISALSTRSSDKLGQTFFSKFSVFYPPPPPICRPTRRPAHPQYRKVRPFLMVDIYHF